MNATVKFKESTLSQAGTIGKILMWMQDNDKFLRDTTLTAVAEQAAIANGLKGNNTRITVLKMYHNQMVNKTASGRKRGRVYINYYHQAIPGYILDRAPQDIQDKVRAMKEGLKDNQHIDEVGCVVTKEEPKKATKEKIKEEIKEEPKEEIKEEPKDDAEKEQAKEIVPAETIEVAQTPERSVAMPVEIKREGKNITLTININLSL